MSQAQPNPNERGPTNQFDRLEQRISALEDELESEREQRRTLEDTVDSLEGELESEQRRRQSLERRLAKFDCEQERVHDAVKRKTDAISERVKDLEREQVEPEDVINANPNGDLLPIQQLYNTVKSGGADTMGANEERAARVWPHFRDYADPSGGKLTLSSTKVRDILDREIGIDHPNPNTVKRVMVFLERFSGDGDDEIITLNTDTKTNRLECDRDDWIDATERMMDAAQQGGR